MKKTLTITEARELFKSEKVFATSSGFIFNDTGKYRPGLTFVLDSSFELNKDGNVVSPIQYVEDREVTDSFNLDLDGKAEILFGDFWKSQEGAPCFRPKDPKQAQHLLVRVNWGGCSDSHRGYYGNAVKECGATYFRRASSNGGGSGYDYWVLPVGYVRQIEGAYRIDWEAARAYCAKHSKLQGDQRSETDRLYKEKLAAEQASRAAKASLLPRLEVVAETLHMLRMDDRALCVELALDDETYFQFGCSEYLYTPKEVERVENYANDCLQLKAKFDAKKAAKQRVYQEFALKFNALQSKAQAVELEIVTDNQERAVLTQAGQLSSGYHVLKGEYSSETLKAFDEKITEVERAQERQRQVEAKIEAEARAKEQGLPSNIRIWKRVGSRTGCCKGWVIGVNGVDRERDDLYNTDSRRASRYDEGYEIWNQILPGELVVQWSKDCTAAEHKFEVVYRPETISEAQLERVAEIQAEIAEEWEGLIGLASGKKSPSIGKGWFGLLMV